MATLAPPQICMSPESIPCARNGLALTTQLYVVQKDYAKDGALHL